MMRTAMDIKRAIELASRYEIGTCVNYKSAYYDPADFSSDASSSDGSDQLNSESQRVSESTSQLPLTIAVYHDIFDGWLKQKRYGLPERFAKGCAKFSYRELKFKPQNETWACLDFMTRIPVTGMSATLDSVEKSNAKNRGRYSEVDKYQAKEYLGLTKDKFEAHKHESFLQYMYENCAQDSPFGDVKSCTTVMDAKVRLARQVTLETNDFSNIVEKVESLWSAHMLPRRVKAVPYKINLYGEDGFFKPHKDTPSKKLVGSFLVGLGYAKVVGDSDTTTDVIKEPPTHLLLPYENVEWKCSPGNWICFYTDVVHEVLPCLGAGVRGTISFKMYEADEADDQLEKSIRVACATGDTYDEFMPEKKKAKYDETCNEEVDAVTHSSDDFQDDADPSVNMSKWWTVERDAMVAKLAQVQRPFGFLLSHEYTISFEEAKGRDLALKEMLNLLPNTVLVMIPVVMNAEVGWGDNDPTTCNTAVCAFTKSHVNTMLHRSDDENQSPKETESLDLQVKACDVLIGKFKSKAPFVAFDFDPNDQWSKKVQQSAEHTGNESLPGSEDSVYLQGALIVFDSEHLVDDEE